jgi:hypothetical protein
MSEAIFHVDGDLLIPTVLARGPWTPDAQHGGPPSALLAHAIERSDDGAAFVVVRMTVELLRPVPIAPLQVRTRLARPGKKVQLVEASLVVAATDTEVARATGLRMRRTSLPIPEGAAPHGALPPPSAGAASRPPWAARLDYEGFHSGGAELRFVAGTFERPGPAAAWIRLRVPLVAGEATSPLCRVAVAADFGNGISWVLDRTQGYRFINPDLTIALHRHPVGEWVGLESVTAPDTLGVGIAESRLYDQHGPLGRSIQTLLLEHDG